MLPTILAWESVEDLDTELDPQDKQVCFVRNKYVPESFRKLLVACMFPKSGSKTFCVSFVRFVFLFFLSFASLNEKSNLKDTKF